MLQDESEMYGPVGAPQEDLGVQDEYDDTTPATITDGSASTQVEPLPGENDDPPGSTPSQSS